MGTHPSFSSAGPSSNYQPKTTDESDFSVSGTVVPSVNSQAADGAQVTIGAKADVAATAPATPASWSAIALLKAVWTAVSRSGQALGASSLPVVIASDQSSVPVSVADGSDGTLGAKADTAWGGTGSGSAIAVLKAIVAGVSGPLPAGSSVIGTVNTQAGSIGIDRSANTPTLPNVGAAFAASGPYASYALVLTVPAGSRNKIDIENLSGSQIVVIRDDGTAAPGAAATNASIIALSGGSAVGAQGGSWESTTFKGRVQVYAPLSTAQVTAFAD